MDSAWFEEGLRFSCTQCGACCSGDPGHVWVNPEEIAALATQLSLSVTDFESRYVRRVGSRRSLFERHSGDCIFLHETTRRCTVYEARPVQCRTWPFWPDNVATPQAWTETAGVCPGTGRGELHPLVQIRRKLGEHLAARRKR